MNQFDWYIFDDRYDWLDGSVVEEDEETYIGEEDYEE